MGSTEGEHNLTSADPKMESSDDWTIVSSIDEVIFKTLFFTLSFFIFKPQ